MGKVSIARLQLRELVLNLVEPGAGLALHIGDDRLIPREALLKELQTVGEARVVTDEIPPGAPRARHGPMQLRKMILGDCVLEERAQMRRRRRTLELEAALVANQAIGRCVRVGNG